MADLTFLTGPVRSGKSARAVEIAQAWGDGVVFIATWLTDPADADMLERVQRHQAERPSGWRTLEAPADIAAALDALSLSPAGVVLDSIVLWAAARFDHPDATILDEWSALLRHLRDAPYPAVIVGDEIGWSPVPMDAALRRFRDLTGWLGQRTAAAATEAWLLVAGCPVQLK
jgi:adenosylcobinamide kinase/adenosylcobinamide-phosphate guanylyltransferase